MRTVSTTLPALVLLIASCGVCAAQDREAAAEHAMKRIFGDSIVVSMRKVTLSDSDQHQIAARARSLWSHDTIDIHVCTRGTQIVGYGFVDDVKGKMQYITYLVALLPSGEVKDLDILFYRESHGGEITYESFRSQFRGKSAADNLDPRNGIRNISGATISVRAITNGVRKILQTYPLIRNRLE